MNKCLVSQQLAPMSFVLILVIAFGNAYGQSVPKPLLQLTPTKGHVFTDAAININQAHIASVGSRHAWLWDLKTGAGKQAIELPPGGQFWSVSPNGKYGIEYWTTTDRAGRWKAEFSLWSLKPKKKIFSKQATESLPIFSPDGEMMAYPEWKPIKTPADRLSTKRSLVVVDLNTRKRRKTSAVPGGFRSYAHEIKFSSDNTRLAAVQPLDDRNQNRVHVWDVVDLKTIFQQDMNFRPNLAFSPHNQHLFVGGWNREIYDIQTGSVISKYEGEKIRGLRFFEFSPIEDLVAGKDFTGKIYFWDWKRQSLTSWQAHDEPVRSIAFSPDGKTIATTEMDQDSSNIWDVTTRQKIARLPTGVKPNSYVTAKFSPDGNQLITFSPTQMLVWDVNRLRENFKPAILVAKKAKSGKGNLGRIGPGDKAINDPADEKNEGFGVLSKVAQGGLKPEWAPILTAIPDTVNNILIYRHADILAGEDIVTQITPKNKENISQEFTRAMKPSAADYFQREWATDKIPEYTLLGYFEEIKDDGSGGIHVEFALSDRPLKFESIKKNLKGTMRNRQFKGEKYVAGAKGKVAAYMPNSNVLFVGKKPADIEAVIDQLQQKPSKISLWINQSLEPNQFLVLQSDHNIRELAFHLASNRPEDLKGLSEKEIVELWEEFERKKADWDSLQSMTFVGSVTERPKFDLSLEFTDDDAAANVLAKLDLYLVRLKQALATTRLDPQSAYLKLFLNAAQPKVEGRILKLTTPQGSVKNVVPQIKKELTK